MMCYFWGLHRWLFFFFFPDSKSTLLTICAYTMETCRHPPIKCTNWPAAGWWWLLKNACITYSNLKMHRHAQTVHVIFFMLWFKTGQTAPTGRVVLREPTVTTCSLLQNKSMSPCIVKQLITQNCTASVPPYWCCLMVEDTAIHCGLFSAITRTFLDHKVIRSGFLAVAPTVRRAGVLAYDAFAPLSSR